ncbi:protein commissureless 1 [Drosophila tropicalis]|uniref:protein commissureless 1 n=1 Tax=Drosophila tropicalis TaxID=46794 RepID=UPI0035ABB377
METTTTLATPTEEIYAEFIAAPASSMSPSAIAEHMQQNQITFEIPTAHDLRHIDAMHSSSSSSSLSAASSYLFNFNTLLSSNDDSGNSMNSISTEQLSKSVVLDLADLREQSEHTDSWWSDVFGDAADMNVIINYLWIGVVSSLVILSLVFIIFSCYFYRKFRTWKKCNKDIRAQIHASNDSYSSHGVSHHLISCDASRLLLQQQQQQQHQHQQQQQQQHLSSGNNEMEAAFYQIESPPCYTIATGLPSYDEALHHQPRHFAYGMKFVYPSLAAVHHHQAQAQAQAQARICNWEKDELQQHKLQKCKLSAAVAAAMATSGQEENKANAAASNSVSVLPSAICINMPDEPKQHQQQEEQQQQQEVATLQPAAAADDDCASLVVVVSA